MTLKIFIGMDRRQPLAYTVLQNSIIRKATNPNYSITPLLYPQLEHIVKRKGLTEFTYTRFLVPYLCDYKGWGLFLDADMLLRADITELETLQDPESSVMVVKNVERFEWPSLMYFNNEKCTRLTPEYIENANPFKFEWADKIGELPAEWNHCVGYDKPNDNAKLVHFTQGIPCFPETENSEYGAYWRRELELANMTCDWAEIMGNSVHYQRVVKRA